MTVLPHVAAEAAPAPLSDQKLCTQLRFTVYREGGSGHVSGLRMQRVYASAMAVVGVKT